MKFVSRHLPLIAALLAGCVLVGPIASGAGDYPQISSEIPAFARRMLEEGYSNYAVRYDDHVGYFRLEVRGNRGGFVRAHLYFTGFYMRIVPTLSYAKHYGTPYDIGAPNYDHYFIIPRHVSATVSVGVERKAKCGKGVIQYRFDGSLANKDFKFPSPPNTKSRDASIPRWMMACAQKYARQFFFSLRVRSRAAVGGPIQLFPDFGLYVPGRKTLATSRSSRSATGRARHTIGFSVASQPRLYMKCIPQATLWKLPAPIELSRFSLEDISLQCSGSGTFYPRWTGCQILSDTEYSFRYQLAIGARKRIKAVLRSADADAGIWLPAPGVVRTYRLTLEDPEHEEVSAIRFILEDTSSHPGVATNAGNHVRFAQCPDCTLGKQPEVIFSREDFKGVPLQRGYTHYNGCPLDLLPDVFFSSRENPGLDLSEDGTSHNLQYTISQRAYLNQVDHNEITVKVKVMDGAASSRLRAEVQVGGLWYQARAEGPEADSDGLHIMIPVDKDRNGLGDRWEQFFATHDPDEDRDSRPGASQPGDGLTAFEEYRGVYTQGNFFRLSPREKDVFVHDYSAQYGDALDGADSIFRKCGLSLWELEGDEFRDEVVNYQDSGHKKGDQYAIVVMPLSQIPGLKLSKIWAGMASYVGPPVREHHTLVMRDFLDVSKPLAQWADTSQSEAKILAHELGHLMSLPHHGDKDRMIVVDASGREEWVACRSGQHSGRKDCIMRYNCAAYFLDMDFIPRSAITRFVLDIKDRLQPFDDFGQADMVCRDAQGDSVCGPATCGACLERLNVKSY